MVSRIAVCPRAVQLSAVLQVVLLHYETRYACMRVRPAKLPVKAEEDHRSERLLLVALWTMRRQASGQLRNASPGEKQQTYGTCAPKNGRFSYVLEYNKVA